MYTYTKFSFRADSQISYQLPPRREDTKSALLVYRSHLHKYVFFYASTGRFFVVTKEDGRYFKYKQASGACRAGSASNIMSSLATISSKAQQEAAEKAIESEKVNTSLIWTGLKVKRSENEDGVVQWKNEDNMTISYHNFFDGTLELDGLACVLLSPAAAFKWVVGRCDERLGRHALCDRIGERTKCTWPDTEVRDLRFHLKNFADRIPLGVDCEEQAAKAGPTSLYLTFEI